MHPAREHSSNHVVARLERLEMQQRGLDATRLQLIGAAVAVAIGNRQHIGHEREMAYRALQGHCRRGEEWADRFQRNLAFLCRSHHSLKHHSLWRVSQELRGILRWASPTGHSYVDRPAGQYPAHSGGSPPPTQKGGPPGDPPGLGPPSSNVRLNSPQPR